MTRPNLEDLVALRLKGKEVNTVRLEGKLYLPFNRIELAQDFRTKAISAAFIQYQGVKRTYVHEVEDLSRMNSTTGPFSTFNFEGLLFVREQPVEPPIYTGRARLF